MLAQRLPRQRVPGPSSRLLVLACLALSAACAPRRAERPPGPVATPPPGGATPIPAGSRRFVIDPDQSVVSIRVYRAGPLARLGHNHVVTSGDESGYAWLGQSPGDCGFQLRLPVAALVVDDPDARRQAGADFAASVPDDAREGTRRNMLSQAVLDEEHYPWITVRADRLEGAWSGLSATVTIAIRDARPTVAVPLEILREGGRLSAHGTVSLRQSDLGLVPFSVAGGAIQVADSLEIEFTVVAVEP
jgi:hypothetical protein